MLVKYPVRAALNPFVSSSAYLFPYLVSGSIVVSLVLGLPTVGPLLLQALVAQDMFLAGTIVLLLGVLTVLGTLIGCLIMSVLKNGCVHEGIANPIQDIIIGAIIVAAVALDRFRRRSEGL